MEATCWSDYLCPWCYLGQDRSALMASLGLEVVHLPYELLAEVSNRILNEVPGINRVLYDISTKPPASIEWE